ncbi:phosphoribosylformylglycinamidine synthase subunit PurQ [Candidatus Gottesmanbacteria bacterium]|nr:phosphoribosylformylglycinamidine synthase subunit PurQ [Candidatus Gottesmanbacteria bacterium]
MNKPRVIVLSGYGLNCEEEARFGFELAGAVSEIVHINDIISKQKKLSSYQILVVPGGFSFGDDLGSGLAFASRMRNHLWEEILSFVRRDKLVLGICNGFQILANLGLLPALDGRFGKREIALLLNKNARYTVRWVDLKVTNDSLWLRGITTLSLPIAHGEGKFFASREVLKKLEKKKRIALRYFRGTICTAIDLSDNPNGSVENIAAVTDPTGKIFGLMPHPDRALYSFQHPLWHRQKEELLRRKVKLPKFGDGYFIFQNAVKYFSS